MQKISLINFRFSQGLMEYLVIWYNILGSYFAKISIRVYNRLQLRLKFIFFNKLHIVFFPSITSVQFSRSVVSDSLRPHESQHARPPVHHQLPELTQTHVHRVGDAIQPSHPLSPPSHPAPNPSQHQGLFQWVNSWHEVATVLEFQLQHQSFQWTPRTDLL